MTASEAVKEIGVLQSEVRLLKNDKEHLLNLVDEEKQKNLKAKQKLIACCKNSADKIQNQREQLKACNEKIKEQQAEIERLTSENERLYGKVEELSMVLSDTIKIRYKEAKSEAYKEFAERVKAMKFTEDTISADEVVFVEDIDNLLKEMG